MINDLRLALRTLRQSPGFTAIAVASLAIGIGASTAIFSFLNAMRLRSLPVPAPHELRLVNWMGRNPEMNSYSGGGETKVGGGFRAGGSFPYPAYREFRDRGTGFASVFAFFPMPRITVLARGQALTADGLMVSGNFFAGYGVSTLIGRPLTPEDDRPGATPAAVITYRMWEQQFALDPHVLGQTLALNRNAVTVVGVLPRGYVGPLPGDSARFYVPLALQPTLVPSRPLDSANRWWVRIMARMAPGADEAQTQASLGLLFRQVLAGSSSTMDEPGILLQDGAHGAELGLRNKGAAAMLAMLAFIGVVLAIACANVAGLLLARGAARQHELAVRAAIGAGRWRLVRQSFTESLLLALLAAGVGLLLAASGKVVLLRSFGSLSESFHLDLRTDATVLAFTFGLALLTCLVFGLLPALRAGHADPAVGLKSRSAATGSRLRLGRALVTAQVGLSVLLVALGGLAVRSFTNLARVDPGFNPENVLLFRLNPGQGGYEGQPLATFYAEARRSLAAIPGVRSVAVASQALAGDGSEVTGIELRGGAARPGESGDVSVLVASEGFLDTLGIPVLLGRDLAVSDTASSAPVAVVNETFARTLFPGANPLGQSFLVQDGRGHTFTIVGLARDAKYASIRDEVPPLAIFSNQQMERGAMVFAVRSVLPPLSLVPAARKAIAALDPQLPLSAIRTQEQVVDQSLVIDRITAALCGSLAGLALLLSCIGLFGLMAYDVARRTKEIGIRAALGATRQQLARSILRGALLLTGAGLALGLPAAVAVTRLLESRLYGVAPSDPLTLAGSVAILLAVAVLASWIPARRAAQVDPMVALRCE